MLENLINNCSDADFAVCHLKSGTSNRCCNCCNNKKKRVTQCAMRCCQNASVKWAVRKAIPSIDRELSSNKCNQAVFISMDRSTHVFCE